MKKIFGVMFGIILCLISVQPCIIAQNSAILDPVSKPRLFNTQNIKVYIPYNNLATTMKHAFMDWEKHTLYHFTFKYVSNKNDSVIQTIFVDSGIGNICGKANALACTKYMILTNSSKTKYWLSDIKIYISTRDNTGKFMTKNQVYTIMLHEIGHSLGLEHSKERNSLMFEGTNSKIAEMQEIQYSDIKALYELYGIKFSKK